MSPGTAVWHAIVTVVVVVSVAVFVEMAVVGCVVAIVVVVVVLATVVVVSTTMFIKQGVGQCSLGVALKYNCTSSKLDDSVRPGYHSGCRFTPLFITHSTFV